MKGSLISSLKEFLSMALKTKREVRCKDQMVFVCVCVWVCLHADAVWMLSVLCSCAVFIGVIHASIIEGNHFTAKLYCNYGDEKLLFRSTNTEF